MCVAPRLLLRSPKVTVTEEPVRTPVTVSALDRTDLTCRCQVRVRPVTVRDGSETQIVAVPSRFSWIWTQTGALAVTLPAVPASQKLTPVNPREGTRMPVRRASLARIWSQPVSAARAAVRALLAPGSRMYA